MTTSDFRQLADLAIRDVLVVDSLSRVPQFRILSRRNCIILTLGSIRCVVFHDRCLVALMERPSRTATRFLLRLRAAAKRFAAAQPQQRASAASGAAGMASFLAASAPGLGATSPSPLAELADGQEEEHAERLAGMPFELLILDTALAASFNSLDAKVRFCRPLAQAALRDLAAQPDRLYSLYPIRHTLDHLARSTSNLMRALQDVVSDDRDLREACLTAKALAAGPDVSWMGTLPSKSGTRRGGRAVGAGTHGRRRHRPSAIELNVTRDEAGEVETLLESYYQLVMESHQDAEDLIRTIETKQEIVDTQLDLARNHLIEVELRLAMVGTGIGVGTLVTGGFGMNLVSGLEEVPGLFWGVAASSGFGLVFLYRAIRKLTLRTSPAGQLAHRIDEFMRRIEKVDLPPSAARTQRQEAQVVVARHSLQTAAAAHRMPTPDDGVQEHGSGFQGYQTTTDFLQPVAPRWIRRVLGEVDDDHRLVRLDPTQFSAVYHAKTGRWPSTGEVEMVFDVFDSDHDGHLGMDEVMGVIGDGSAGSGIILGLDRDDDDGEEGQAERSEADLLVSGGSPVLDR